MSDFTKALAVACDRFYRDAQVPGGPDYDPRAALYGDCAKGAQRREFARHVWASMRESARSSAKWARGLELAARRLRGETVTRARPEDLELAREFEAHGTEAVSALMQAARDHRLDAHRQRFQLRLLEREAKRALANRRGARMRPTLAPRPINRARRARRARSSAASTTSSAGDDPPGPRYRRPRSNLRRGGEQC